MRVAFTRAYNPQQPYQWLMPPLGIGYMLAVLKRQGAHEAVFLRDEADVTAMRPDVIAISSATENFTHAQAMARRFKEALGPDVFILVGGIHITVLPHTLPDCFDLGVLGEGEPVIGRILDALAEGRASSAAWRQIPGVAWHEAGGVQVNGERQTVDDLDALPWPDREGLGGGWAWPPHRIVHLIASRGCPYDCAFCSSGREWTVYRRFSPEYVVQEITHIRERYDPEQIFFFDDLFVADRKHFRRFCELLRERRLHEGVVFRSYARVNLVDEELVDLFEAHHFRYIDFGFESNCERTLRYLGKTGVTPEVNARALDRMRGRALSVGANMIVGAPDETLEEMQSSYDFIADNRDVIDRLSVGPLMTMPGTRVWREALERELVSETMDDWSRLSNEPDAWTPERYILLNQRIAPDAFADFLRRFWALQEEINQKGQLREAAMDRMFHEATLRQLKDELKALKGSRLVRGALWLRDRLGRSTTPRRS